MRSKKFLIIGFITFIIALILEIGKVRGSIGIVKFNSSYCNTAITILAFIGIDVLIKYTIDNYYR